MLVEKDDIVCHTFSRTPSRGEIIFVCVGRSEKRLKNSFNNGTKKSYAQKILLLIMPDFCN